MRSVGIRKKSWFKTAGVCAFAAQLLGGAGLAGADNTKTCVPTAAFVSGGDPVIGSLTPDNITKWTGSAGYGWNQGAGAQISYETALANNTDTTKGPEINGKWMLLSFMSQVSMPQIDNFTGIRVGVDYPFTDPGTHVAETVSQIITMTFDPQSPTSPWNATPNNCPDANNADCANDPTTDPSTWTSLSPASVSLLKKINVGTAPSESTGWTGSTDWVTSHTKLWIWADRSVSPAKYYWRINMALPIRTTINDPSANWTSQSVYFDPNSFQATGKVIPGFWAEMVTDATAKVNNTVPKVIYHFPDWASTAEPARDSSNIPDKSAWGQAEIGSVRGALTGDLTCAGTGVAVEGTVGDNVLWHSAIWNNLMSTTNVGDTSAWDLAGTLKMIDTSTNTQAHNNMSVLITNLAGKTVNTSDVHATFLIAPYGSQAANTIWSPLNAGDSSTHGGNSYTCNNAGAGTTRNASCTPLPKVFPPIDSTPAPGTASQMAATGEATLNMAQDWVPSPDYVCAVQTADAPGALKWWHQTLGSNPGQFCSSAVYLPTDMTGMAGNPPGSQAGLPAHQCMQAQLSGTGVQFALKSAFRNMHVAPASLYREAATIDTRGLPKVKNKSYHDVYLYVETRNMPYRDDAGGTPMTIADTVKQYTAINQYCGRIEIGSPKINAARTAEGIDCRGYNPDVPVPSEDFLSKRMPTLIVHAYADTGLTQKIHGKKVPVLTPMTSFGQFVTHDAGTEGKVFGWNAGLEPFGNTPFQKVGVDTYKIQIPNDGAGQVVTRVEPLPTKRPVCDGDVDMDIVTLLQSLAPLISLDHDDAGEINGLINSLHIACVPLHEILAKLDKLPWGGWQSWIHYLITQIELTDGCHCK
jgi:hypothetical protein